MPTASAVPPTPGTRPRSARTTREWLASYYTGLSREHSDAEPERFACMGARKLYDAVNKKKVTDVAWRKLWARPLRCA